MTLLTPVIVQAERQRAKVERLAAFIQKLDGTVLKIVDAEGRNGTPYPDSNNHAFHQAALEMKGQPFVWMEPDAIPRKEGWLEALTKEYRERGKEFLVSSDVNPPHDLVGGIGVYGPNTHWLIPENFRSHGWDMWMAQHLKPLTAFTPLIQHTYGNYNEQGIASPHRFPEDNHLLRADAVLFHSDKFQHLIPGTRTAKRFYHTGDLGDIIAALPAIRQLGGGELVIGNHSHGGWRPMEGARFDAIKALVEAQPYISNVRFEHQPEEVDFDISGFRRVYSRRYSLSEAQARWLNVSNLNLAPWLEVDPPSELSKGKIIVARSGRYQNRRFPWRQLVRSYGRRMAFVGFPEEFDSFVRDSGGNGLVTYFPTGTLMEMAALIKGSDLFIGNQSCHCWVAMGLGHRMIQETHETIHDSIVTRENARFFTGSNSRCFAELGVPI